MVVVVLVDVVVEVLVVLVDVVVVVLVDVVVVVLVDVVLVVVIGVPPVYPKSTTNRGLPPINEGGGGYKLVLKGLSINSKFIGPLIGDKEPLSFGITL